MALGMRQRWPLDLVVDHIFTLCKYDNDSSNHILYLQSTAIMATETITTISPITNKPIVTRQGPSASELEALPKRSWAAFESYKKTSLAERQKIVRKALDLITARQDELAKEITEQMGRPIAYTAKEVTTAVARGEYMLKISDDALADTPGEPQEGFNRYIRKVPLGPVLVLFAWNVGVFHIVLQRQDSLTSRSTHISS